jgi:hypothetical protein
MASLHNNEISTTLISTKDTMRKIIDMIYQKQGGIYLRYGDGDFNILIGHDDMLAVCTSNFQHWIREGMLFYSPNVLTAIPHHCSEMGTLETGMFPGNHECPLEVVQECINKLSILQNGIPPILYSSVALCFCAAHTPDIIIELHKELKKHHIVFIGNQTYSNEYLTTLFGTSLHRINTPIRDSYIEHDRIFSEFNTLYQQSHHSFDYFVIIMAAGCGGRAFTSEIYSKYPSLNYFILDYGSLLDYMWGENSRAYMDLDPPNIERILREI